VVVVADWWWGWEVVFIGEVKLVLEVILMHDLV
jgi:hypothetical protein